MKLSSESSPEEILRAMRIDRQAREARTAARTLTNSAKASKIRFFTDPEVLAERVYAKCPELKALRDAAVKEASELKSKIAATVAKTNELRRAIASTPKVQPTAPKSLYQEYRELQKSNPAAAGAFWNQHEKDIIAGK